MDMVNLDNIMLQQVVNVTEHELWEYCFGRCLKYSPVGRKSQLSKQKQNQTKKTHSLGKVTSSRFLHNTKFPPIKLPA